MCRILKLLSVVALLSFSSWVIATNEATGFVYPVGNQYSPPTEQSGNANGFTIIQNFNTSSIWVGGGANGGWCEGPTGQDNRYQSKTSCVAAGENWKYGHTGVDLANGICGGEIRAIANGVVEFSGWADRYGNLLKIKHALPNGRVAYSIYGHRQSALMSFKQVVTKGQIVGYVGNSGNVPCHLHFAIYDESMPNAGGSSVPPGYVYDDSGQPPDKAQANIMRRFYDPLLFINDRNKESQAVIPGIGYWYTSFSGTQAVTTRTAFISDAAGNSKSLQVAADLGWMSSTLWRWDGFWAQQTGPMESQTAYAGYYYRFYLLQSNRVLHWFLPGNNYLLGRWLQDTYEFTTVNGNLNFGRGLRDTYSSNANWTWDFGLAQMAYEQNINGSLRYAWVYVAFSKNNPLVRYVCYYNPMTSVFSSWIQVH